MNCLKNNYIQLRNDIKSNLKKDLIIICIGTDRSTGDSLGPLIGTLLSDMNIKNFKIYGTLENPVHAINLQEILDLIETNYQDPYILAIDACLGRHSSVGKIRFKNKPVKPGAGVNKDLPLVGNSSIIGVVNVSGFMEFFVLQNTRLNLVFNMARDISSIIKNVDNYITKRLKKKLVKK